ncbi:uncharacterized protein sima isoform X2 [Bactrocera oleae]|uniref:uncharacterized protein sima isoform X2 n=1 Tax=Bactrocera oleae TaxID=104688 RepID=UPI00387EA20D
MYPNQNSWLTFVEEAYSLFDDNSDKLLDNLCTECLEYECEHRSNSNNEQATTQENLHKQQLEFAAENSTQLHDKSLYTNTDSNQYYARVPSELQQHEQHVTFADFGFRSTCDDADGNGGGCHKADCALEQHQQQPQRMAQHNLQQHQPQTMKQHSLHQQQSLQQRNYGYQREDQTYGVTVHPPRNYPALEVVPGITYSINQTLPQNSYHNNHQQRQQLPIQQQQPPSSMRQHQLPIQQQQLHMPQFQQQQYPLPQQQLQPVKNFTPQPQQFVQNPYQPNQQLQRPIGYQPSLYHQPLYQQKNMNTHVNYPQMPPVQQPAYPVQNYRNGGYPAPMAERSAACCQQAPINASGVNVQRLLGHAPCRGNTPWSYSYCYGDTQNNYEPCHFINCVDIEDFLNNEKRKEKSRDAARCRRSRETEIFSELAQILPLRKDDVNQLDKASIMRIAIAFLKVREMLELFPKIQDLLGDIKLDNNIDENSNSSTQMSISSTENSDGKFDLLKCAEATQFIKQTLDGFLIILSNDGDITYVSDNITDYLGLAKIDILGQQIWEYSHQCDHAELKEALNIKRKGLPDKIKDENMIEEGISTEHRDLFVRLKCTLTSRGRSINIKSASYKVIHITGHLVVNMKDDRVLVAIGRPIPHPSNIEIPLGSTTFLTKHSLDMKFTYVDEKMQNLFGYKAEDLLDQSLFACHHGGDSNRLMATFKTEIMQMEGPPQFF